MPNAINLLEQDHRKVEKLFTQFEQTGDQGIALEICQELEVHTTLEEEIVYPVLRAKVDRKMAAEAQQEHDEADQLIKKIKKASGAQLQQLVGKLKEAVEHHVEEEETEVFPKMQQKVGTELTRMGTEIQQRKSQLTAGGADLLDLTKEELYEKARKADIPGRSSMTKEELAEALSSQG
jgi:iron-sulfur cluster repair protein YtfE (RIC family)